MSETALVLNGSICLTDLVELAKSGHSAFSRGGKNNKVYVAFTQWVNEEPDQYKNHSSLLLNPTKEQKDADLAKFGKCYFGNAKKSDRDVKPVGDASDLDLSGANVTTRPASAGGAADSGTAGFGGLPF